MREPSLEEGISAAISWNLNNINTSMPGIIVRVLNDLSGMSVDVQPTLNMKWQDGTVVERPPILNVPLQFPCSTTSAFTFPVNPGDCVLLIFSQRGMDSWKSGNGYQTTPTDYRKFDGRDAVAIPGIYPPGRSINDPVKRRWNHNTRDTVVAHNIGTGNEVEIRLKEDGRVLINTDAGLEVNAPETIWNGNIVHTGVLSSNGVIVDSHTHTGVDTGPGVSGPPVK